MNTRRLKLCSFLLSFLLFCGAAQAQLTNTDIEYVAAYTASKVVSTSYYPRQGNNKNWMQEKQKSAVAKYNPVSFTASGLMYVYQHVISPQLSKSCPYYITCSNFAKQSIHRFGLFKGVLIAGDRLMRCNRIGLMDVSDINVDETTHTIIDNPETYR